MRRLKRLLTALEHLRLAALMDSKAKQAAPENKPGLVSLANAHRTLARKAEARERKLADAGNLQEPDPGVEPRTTATRSIDLRLLLKDAPHHAAPLAKWMDYLAEVQTMPDFVQKAVVVHAIKLTIAQRTQELESLFHRKRSVH